MTLASPPAPTGTKPEDPAPAPPRSSLPWHRRVAAMRWPHLGAATIRDADGPVVAVSLGPRALVPLFVMVTSPAGARDVLGAGGVGLLDKTMLIHRETHFLGTNSFNLPHAPWKPRRRTVQPLFTRKHVTTYAGHMAAAAEAHADRWPAGATVDLDAEMRALTLDVLGRSLFGVDLDRHSADLAPCISTVLHRITARGLSPVRTPHWLPTPSRARARRALATMRSVVEEAVAAARSRGADDDGRCLVDLLLEAQDPESGTPLTHQQVVDELIVFLIAGHDTTATTLAYALWQVGRHAALQEELVREVAALGDRPLVTEDVPALELTVRVLHEAMRLCPPAAIAGRRAERDVVVDGFTVPAGADVGVSMYTLHRDPTLWEDPEVFDPDRFLPERSAGRDRWAYLPFGGGPRSCVGDHFAMLEATLALATLVRRCRWESLASEFPTDLPFTLTAAGPVPARVSRRT